MRFGTLMKPNNQTHPAGDYPNPCIDTILILQVNQQQQQQQAQRPGGWAMFKTLLVRMFFIYMISSFFRRSSTPAPQGKPGEAPVNLPAMNIFPKESVLVCIVDLETVPTK